MYTDDYLTYGDIVDGLLELKVYNDSVYGLLECSLYLSKESTIELIKNLSDKLGCITQIKNHH